MTIHDPHDERDPRHERLCAFLFGELEPAERAAFEAELERDPELAAERRRLEATIGLTLRAIPEPELSPAARDTLRRAAARRVGARPWPLRLLRGGRGIVRLAAAAAVLVLGVFGYQAWRGGEMAGRTAGSVAKKGSEGGRDYAYTIFGRASDEKDAQHALGSGAADSLKGLGYVGGSDEDEGENGQPELNEEDVDALQALGYGESDGGAASAGGSAQREMRAAGRAGLAKERAVAPQDSYRGPGDTAPVGTPAPSTAPTPAVALGLEGGARGKVMNRARTAPGSPAGPSSPGPGGSTVLGHALRGTPPQTAAPEEEEPALLGAASATPPASGETGAAVGEELRELGYAGAPTRRAKEVAPAAVQDLLRFEEAPSRQDDFTGGDTLDLEDSTSGSEDRRQAQAPSRAEQVDHREAEATALTRRLLDGCRLRPGESPAAMFFRYWGDHPFVDTRVEHLSTFAADVDTASYGLARRMLSAGELPPAAEVRTEEFVNAFRPDFPPPVKDTFALGLELAPSRFGPDANTWMLRAVVRGRDVDDIDRQPLALTFVVDVSGSMEESSRLPLVQQALTMLLEKLDASDAVAIVAFRDEATVVSPMVSAAGQRGALEDAIEKLQANGGTNVEAGLVAGFRLAADALTPHAVNRVVFLSDGVGNIGETDQTRILEEVRTERAKGIYLNTIGVGMGDHHDAFLEQLADRGDGMCDYIDSPETARHALVENFTGAFQPIARDVKIQLELDPSVVTEFRQLGYENRALANADFRKDEVDAGEVNAGNQVTALYELRLAPGAGSAAPLATLRVRWKPPFAVDSGHTDAAAAAQAEVATEAATTLTLAGAAPTWDATPFGYRRAVLVAQLAELLRRSVHAHDDRPEDLLAEAERLAPQLHDPDFDGFVELVRLALPLLAAERKAESPELYAKTRELCDLRYRQARRELVHEQADEETLAKEGARIAELEKEIGAAVRQRYGLPPQDPEAQRALKALGYIDSDGK